MRRNKKVRREVSKEIIYLMFLKKNNNNDLASDITKKKREECSSHLSMTHEMVECAQSIFAKERMIVI